MIATSTKNELKTQSVEGEEVDWWRRGRHWPLPLSTSSTQQLRYLINTTFGAFSISESQFRGILTANDTRKFPRPELAFKNNRATDQEEVVSGSRIFS